MVQKTTSAVLVMQLDEFFAHRRFSRVPHERPDSTLFPKYATARQIRIKLGEGDALFLPAGWFHFVFSRETGGSELNIAANFFIKHPTCVDCMNRTRVFATTIKHKTDVTPASFKRHVTQSEPFLHRCFSATHSWPCFQWTRDKLVNAMGTSPQVVAVSTDNMFASNWIRCFDTEHTMEKIMTFNDFLEADDKNPGKRHYLLQATDTDAARDIGSPVYVDPRSMRPAALWINMGDVYSSLHYDSHDNLLVQISGTKDIILFPPSEGDKLYLYNPYPPSLLCHLRNQAPNAAPMHATTPRTT